MQPHHIGGSLPCCDQLTQAFAPFQNSPAAYTGKSCFQCALSPGWLPRKPRYPPEGPQAMPQGRGCGGTGTPATDPAGLQRPLEGLAQLYSTRE